nr:hypothetical protein [uncultured Pseudomonas sp.]
MTTPTQESKRPEFNQAELDSRIENAIFSYNRNEGYQYIRYASRPDVTDSEVVRMPNVPTGRVIRVQCGTMSDVINSVVELTQKGYERTYNELDGYIADQLTVYFHVQDAQAEHDIAAIKHAVEAEYEAELAAKKKAFVERQVELTMASRKRQIELEVARREAQEAEQLRAEIEAELFGDVVEQPQQAPRARRGAK